MAYARTNESRDNVYVIFRTCDILEIKARYRRKTVKMAPMAPEISSMPTGVRGYITRGTTN